MHLHCFNKCLVQQSHQHPWSYTCSLWILISIIHCTKYLLGSHVDVNEPLMCSKMSWYIVCYLWRTKTHGCQWIIISLRAVILLIFQPWYLREINKIPSKESVRTEIHNSAAHEKPQPWPGILVLCYIVWQFLDFPYRSISWHSLPVLSPLFSANVFLSRCSLPVRKAI